MPAVYHTQINDVLLSALAQALGSWSGEKRVLVDLEGHGREPLFEDVDLSSSVGWFTSLFPVLLELPSVPGPGELLKSVKEQLRRIPHHGIGYGLLRYLCEDVEVRSQLASLPQAQVLFNYLGQFDQVLNDSAMFGEALEDPGRMSSKMGQRSHALTVLSQVRHGRLEVGWVFSEDLFQPSTVRVLAERYLEALRAIISHCQSPQAGGYTPSDFPRAKVSQAVLDRLPTSIVDIYGLAPMQSGMLFHTLYAARPGVYLDQILYALDGEVIVDIVQQAWQYLIDRHPVLRTSFHWEHVAEPIQVVHSHARLAFDYHDWRSHTATLTEPKFADLLNQDRAVGFDLSQAPLLRVTLVRTDERAWRMLMTVHHLLLDRWSVSLVLSEFKMAYQAICQASSVVLPAVQPYGEYIAWLQDRDQVAAEAYWRRSLSGIAAPTALPIDSSPGALPGRNLPSQREISLSEMVTSSLQVIARRAHLTMNTMVQGAWAMLLSRYGGEEDVMFGVTVSGRPAALHGVEDMVGLFINSLPLRVSVEAGSQLLPWLKQLQDSLLELRDYEYSSLVDIQGWSEIQRGIPMFDSLMIVQNTPIAPPSPLVGIDMCSLSSVSSVDFPLMLIAVPGNQLRILISYDTDRFESEAIERLLVHFRTLLESIVVDPRQRLSQLPILTDAERRQLVVEWNTTAADYERERCLHELFEAQVERTPEAVALVFEGEQLTYSQLNVRANQLAHFLRLQGVRSNTLVAICMARSVEMVVSLLAILKSGGAYVAIDPSYPVERIRYTLEDASASLLLTQDALVNQLPVACTRTLCVDRDAVMISAQPACDLGCITQPTDLAYVLYTSGSTGRPKGVAIEHHSPVALVSWALGQLTSEELSGVVFATSICFDLSVYELFVTLCGGGRVLLVENALAIGTLGTELRPSLINTVPSAMAELLRQGAVPATVMRVNLAGEPLTGSLVDAIYDQTGVRHVYDLYGPSEDTTYSTCALRERGGRVTIGRPISNTTAYVLDTCLWPSPVGVPGELYIGGDGLARGYLNRAELTAERFVPDPFSSQPGRRLYKTGDLVRYRSDGNLEYLGRLDHQVKVRGFRIELGEIENALLSYAGVHEAVVLAREDAPGDRRLVAYIGTSESALNSSLLRDHLQNMLPGYMIPSAFVVLETLPLTPNGKVDRKALPGDETG